MISFGQCVSLVGLIGPFLQTNAEARAAATPVFQLIDEVGDFFVYRLSLFPLLPSI